VRKDETRAKESNNLTNMDFCMSHGELDGREKSDGLFQSFL